MKVNIHFDQNWKDRFLERLENDGPWSNWELFQLAYEAEEYQAVPEFEGLLAPKHLPELEPFPHQIEVANTVIEKNERESHSR